MYPNTEVQRPPTSPAAQPLKNNGFSSRLANSKSTQSQASISSLGIHAESSSATEKRLKLLDHAALLLPGERIAECMRNFAPNREFIEGQHNPTSKSGHYAGLKLCESFACPWCAPFRSEIDREKLTATLVAARQAGLFPILVTLTVRHNRSDKLVDLQQGLTKAFDATFSGRWYADLVEEYGIQGKVKTWETTYGSNGWHPHLHTLVFMEFELVGAWVEEFADRLKTRWKSQLAKVGYDASWEHGIDVQTADSQIADYIAKYGREPLSAEWGVEHEMAKAPVKQANQDGLTPFELLAAAASVGTAALAKLREKIGESVDSTIAGQLFREYFYAFKGRPRLYWGSLLKKLSLKERWLAHFAAKDAEAGQAYTMVMLGRKAWKTVLEKNLRAGLKLVLSVGNVIELSLYLDEHGIDGTITNEAWLRTGLLPPRRHSSRSPHKLPNRCNQVQHVAPG